MRVLAVGDIHTKQWIIDLVESVIDDYDAVVFCGDYADDFRSAARDSIGTWYRLRNLMESHPGKVQAVKGNHDYIYTVRTPTKQSGYDPATQLLLDIPENRDLKDWLTALPITIELDGVTYSHAGLDERWDGKETITSLWQDTSPIWVRPQWAHYRNIKQVAGHTTQETVNEIWPGFWLIDTFSTQPNSTPIGDGSMLEVIDGEKFKKVNHKDE